ncbi:MAG: DUF4139 domain-containing protein [Brevinematia bacterium]
MKRLIIAFILIFGIVSVSLCKTTMFFYRDMVYVILDLDTNLVYIPYESYEIVSKDNKIVEIKETNVIPQSLVAEFSNLVKEIRDIEKKVKSLKIELVKLRSLSELFRSILVSSYQKDVKMVNSMIEEFRLIQEKILDIEENILPELEERKLEKEKRKREIEELQERIKVVRLLRSGGELSYKISGSWNAIYSLDLSKELLSFRLKLSLPEKVKIKVDRLVITSAKFSRDLVEIYLEKLIGNIYNPKSAMYKDTPKLFMKSLPIDEETQDEAESILKEKPSDLGMIWEIDREMILENGTNVEILDNIKTVIYKRYYVIPTKYGNGFVTIGISNLSQTSLLPGNLEILHSSGKLIGNIKIERPIAKNGYFETKGIPIDEISVKRELVEERLENPKFLGSNRKLFRTYKTSIFNNLRADVRLSIIDRVPLPYDDRIKVEIINIEPKPLENYDKIKKEGVFYIDTAIEKNKKLDYTLSYSVEYPADMYYYEYER